MTVGDRLSQEYLVAGDMLIPRQRHHAAQDQQLRPSDLASLTSCGVLEVELLPDPGVPWTVRCGSRHYAVLTRVVGLSPATHVVYTVIDWRNGLTGPCSLIGGRWRDGTYSDADCELMLASLAAGVIGLNRPQATPLQILNTTRSHHDLHR